MTLPSFRSIAKVVAAGATPDGGMRATLMFSPCDGLPDLAKWPMLMLEAMRGRQWRVKLRVIVVRDPGKDECVAKTYQGIIEASKHLPLVTATAVWARSTWGNKTPSWLEQLWTDGFKVEAPDQGQSIWDVLKTTLERSNGGSAIKAGDELKKEGGKPKGPDVGDGSEAPALITATTDTSGGVDVNAVAPSRQSELALLLEAERSLELCATTQWAYSGVSACLREELECVARLKQNREMGKQPDRLLKEDLSPLMAMTSDRYRASATALKTHYDTNCGAAIAPTEIPWANDPHATAGNKRAEVVDRLHLPVNSHVAANQRELSEGTSDEMTRIASQRFYAIQGSPALSRLFGLTFDLHLQRDELEKALGQQLKQTRASAAYVLLAVEDSELPASNPTTFWTLAKYSHASNHFAPTTRGELAVTQDLNAPPQSPSPEEALTQYDGLIVLGQPLKLPAPSNESSISRFMLTSLDVPSATEATLDRRRRAAADRPDPDPKSNEPSVEARGTLARKPTDWSRKTHATAGFVLLDRGRLEQSVTQFAARTIHGDRTKQGFAILDANDLTIGYRVDVAVPLDSHGTMKWHTLMARTIQHGVTGHPHAQHVRWATDKLLGQLSAPNSWRETLDDCVLALPVRLISSGPETAGEPPAPAGRAKANAFVEETVAIWSGEPMAAHCAGPKTDKVQRIDVGAGSVVGLPRDSRTGRCPPPLRFGWSYRFGMRAVYAGAISMSLDEAKARYDSLAVGRMIGKLTVPPYPANGPQRLRRFLRHERIDAPFMLVHRDLALRANGEMGFERCPHAIVRTSDQTEPLRGAPTVTQRIFVPPTVDIHFAAMHGKFDAVRKAVPPDGLPHVRFDAPGGGFPFVKSKTFLGINEEAFDGRRTVSSDTVHDRPRDAVYAEELAARPVPYYPDPAISSYAIAVRYADTDIYLPGQFFVVDVYANEKKDYPYCRPLVLRIERDPTVPRRLDHPRLEKILSHSHRTTGLPAVRNGVEVTVSLAPGDDFEVDVWCIPSEAGLAKTFALVESIGVLALARSRTRDDLKKLSLEDGLKAALREELPESFCAKVEQCMKDGGGWSGLSNADIADGNDGVGGLRAPGHRVLGAIAKALHDTLQRRPLDEIAAVQTLRVTHATLRPLATPHFESAGHLGELKVIRTPDSAYAIPRASHKTDTGTPVGVVASPPTAGAASAPTTAASPASSASAASAAASSPPGTGPAQTSGGTGQEAIATLPEYHLAGDLKLDLRTTGAFELRARTAFATTPTFDDPSRGRSATDIRNGTWPVQGQPLTSLEIFGFDVSSDGTVTLPRQEVTLLSVDKLPVPLPGRFPIGADGLHSLDLEEMTNSVDDGGLGQIKTRHIFPDRKARLLEISILVRPRHEAMMRTANREARDGYFLRPGKNPIEPTVDARHRSMFVWIDAGVRPAEPDTKTALPAFVWRNPPTGAGSRTAVVRIPLGRGWNSSGEDERLGVVVWPPNLFQLQPEVLARDLLEVDDSPGHKGGDEDRARKSRAWSWRPGLRQMNLSNSYVDPEDHMVRDLGFMDEDLGPAGKFITRWGSDPIFPPDEQQPWTPLQSFIHPAAFRDLDQCRRLGFEASKAQYVEMPVRSGNRPGDSQTSVEVSLVTYKPRFSKLTEQWYVDMAIEHPFETQPFLRMGLVRYQEHAPRHLQVSTPVVQWVQLLPRRDFSAATSVSKKGKSAIVTVEGMGVAEPAQVSGNALRTEMSVSILREYTSDSGLPCRKVIQARTPMTSSETATYSVDAPLEYRGLHKRWTGKVSEDVLKADSTAKKNVLDFAFVEECLTAPPATYANEPVTAAVAAGADGENLHLQTGGPRFSVRIPL